MNLIRKLVMGMNLQLFATQTTSTSNPGNDLSPENKTYYDKNLIREASANLVHDQFGQKRNIPKGGGKTIEFRKFSPLPKATTPLTEGVTPNGNRLNVTTITAEVQQYGDYVETSDVLDLTAIDPVILETTQLLGTQGGLTLDTVTRDILQGGTNVIFAPKIADGVETEIFYRRELDGDCLLTVDLVKRAATQLKAMNAPKIDGCYICLIHPYAAHDLTNDPQWIDVHKYSATREIFTGEIGEYAGVRFVESSECKIHRGKDLTAESRNITVKTTLNTPGKTIAIKEAVTAKDAAAMVGRKLILGSGLYTIASATAAAAGSATVTTMEDITVADGTANKVGCPGEGGKDGCAVFGTLFLGANAFGTTSIEGGGMETIVKPLGSSGTADPLNQRATVGWKALKTAERLIEAYIVRVEHSSKRYGDVDGN